MEDVRTWGYLALMLSVRVERNEGQPQTSRRLGIRYPDSSWAHLSITYNAVKLWSRLSQDRTYSTGQAPEGLILRFGVGDDDWFDLQVCNLETICEGQYKQAFHNLCRGQQFE